MNIYDATATRTSGNSNAVDDGSDIFKREDSKNPQPRPSQDSLKDDYNKYDADLKNLQAFRENAATTKLIDTTPTDASLVWRLSPASAGLHIHTPINQLDDAALSHTVVETPNSAESGLLRPSTPSNKDHLVRQSSVRSVLSNASIASTASPGSTLSSPFLAAMSGLTPLPSPLFGKAPAEAWATILTPPPSKHRQTSEDNSQKESSPQTSPPRSRKPYGALLHDSISANTAVHDENLQINGGHGRDRSTSDFKVEQLHNIQRRHATVGPHDKADAARQDHHMQRETYLAERRGLVISAPNSKLNRSSPSTSDATTIYTPKTSGEHARLENGAETDYVQVPGGRSSKRRKFRQLRQLGWGTFSRVVLATSEDIPAGQTPVIESHMDPTKLVAIKIVEHGPAGGANGERIETGLKREIEMLKTVSHPSIIHLKSYEHQSHRTLLVLAYSPGGDLFELTSSKPELLKPRLIQRIFAELVSAVRYLHSNWIVHRDIKLENVLVNLMGDELAALCEPQTHSNPIVTLTDLGLSRRIPEPPLSPLLETRCGSEDYAAPEILLGERYDGRKTDAWALGVLLYALLEGRLPFDPPPGQPERSRNTHRIARCDWIWCRFGDEDGDWDESKPAAVEFAGARPCVEGLLKKVRMGRRSLDDVAEISWVREGIQCPKGLEMRMENDDDDDDNVR